MTTDPKHEHYEILLMKGVDGQLTPTEREELEQHIAECESCKAEYADFQAIKAVTDEVRQRILLDAEVTPLAERREMGHSDQLGFALIIAGSLLFLGFAGWDFFTNPQIPWWARLGVGAIGSGALILFGNIFRRRLQHGAKDPYTQIDM